MQGRLREPQTATQSSDQKFQENPKQPALTRSKFHKVHKAGRGKDLGRIEGLSLVSTQDYLGIGGGCWG